MEVAVSLPLDALVDEFAAAASACEIPGWPCDIRAEVIRAPHRAPSLPAGFGAVYVFALSQDQGRHAPAGPGAVLKVGRVGPNSNPRFSSQHYNPTSARSSLAGSLLRYRVIWPWLGIDELTPLTVKAWMLANLDRGHLFIHGDRLAVIAELEMYIRARLGSIFEGAA